METTVVQTAACDSESQESVLVSCLANVRGPIAGCCGSRHLDVSCVHGQCAGHRELHTGRQVREIAVAAENGNLKPLYQFFKKNTNFGPKVAISLFLPSGVVATTPQEASVWRHHFAKDFDRCFRTVPFENLSNSLQDIGTQVQNCDTGEGTPATPACDKTQQHEAACDPVGAVFLGLGG